MLFQSRSPRRSFVSVRMAGEGLGPSLGRPKVHPAAESSAWVIQWAPAPWMGKGEAHWAQAVPPWRTLCSVGDRPVRYTRGFEVCQGLWQPRQPCWGGAPASRCRQCAARAFRPTVLMHDAENKRVSSGTSKRDSPRGWETWFTLAYAIKTSSTLMALVTNE